MRKEGKIFVLIFLIGIFLVLSISFVSAGLLDWIKELFGVGEEKPIQGEVGELASQSLMAPTYSEISAPDSLISYWVGNAPTKSHGEPLIDITGRNNGTLYTNDGTANKMIDSNVGTEDGSGNRKAINFDGIDDYVKIDNANILSGKTSATIMAWIYIKKHAQVSQSPIVVDRLVGGPQNSDFQLVVYPDNPGAGSNAKKLLFSIFNETSGTPAVSTSEINLNMWNFVVGTYDGSNIRVYVNGVKEGEVPFTGAIPSKSNDLRIGGDAFASYYAGTNPEEQSQFNGGIDEVAIFGKALSPFEIYDYYSNSLAKRSYFDNVVIPVASGQTFSSYYKFEGNANDEYGRNNGVVNGAMEINGKVGKAYSFDGKDDYAKLSNANMLSGAKKATILAWIYLKNYSKTSQSPIIVDRETGAGKSDFQLIVYPDDNNPHKLLFTIWNSSGGITSVISKSDIPLNTWTFVAGVYNTTNLEVYVNGNYENKSSYFKSAIASNSNDLRIGGDTFAPYYPGVKSQFDGTIDEVLILNRSLTSNEIKAYYDNTKDGTKDYFGNSIACIPNCAGKTCGASDGCNGNCTIGSCPTGKTCSNGVCVSSTCTPSCTGKACGADDGCNGRCSSGSCPTGQTCSQNVCVSNEVGRLVSQYKFEIGGNDETFTNNGELKGDAEIVSGGIIGKALKLDGSGDYMEIVDSSSLDINKAVTISAWINPSRIESWKRIVAKSHTSNAAPYTIYGLMFDDKKHLRMEISSGGVRQKVNGVTEIPLNSWTHVAGVYDGSMMRIYVNSYLENYVYNPAGVIDVNNMPLSIGRSGYNDNYFSGMIDEIRIYNKALEGSDVKQIYDSEKNYILIEPSCAKTCSEIGKECGNWDNRCGVIISCPACSSGNCVSGKCIQLGGGLVGYWKLDAYPQTDNGNVVDSSGSDLAGIFNTGEGGKNKAVSPGQVYNALSFDGIDDYVKINNAEILAGKTSAAVMAWIYLKGYAAIHQSPIVVDRDVDGKNDFQFMIRPESDPEKHKLTFALWNSSDGQGRAISTSEIPLNTWTFVAGTYDGSKVEVYINGVESLNIADNGNFSSAIASKSSDLRIGGDVFNGADNNIEFNGTIDEVAIFNRSLTAGEIERYYNNSLNRRNYFDDVSVCIPKTCSEIGKSCGSWSDGCGGNILNCESCVEGICNIAGSCISLQGQSAISYWRFEDNLEDSLKGTNGEVQGEIGFIEGKSGKAISLNGENQFINLPGFANKIPSDEITIMTWINSDAAGSEKRDLFSILPFNGSNRVHAHFPWESQVYFQFGKPHIDAILSYEDSWINNWNHFAFVGSKSGKYLKIFLNGEEVAGYEGEFNSFENIEGNWSIGGRPTEQCSLENQNCSFKGAIDEVAVFGRALSSEEIKKYIKNSAEGRSYFEDSSIPVCEFNTCEKLGKTCGYWDKGCNSGELIFCNECSGGEKCLIGLCIPEDKVCPSGIRKSGKYCLEGLWYKQKGKDAKCENHFECKSNFCIEDGKCVSPGFFRWLINFFKSLWEKLAGKSDDFEDVLAKVNAAGATGTAGTTGVTGQPGISCWDLDGDSVKDASEDINKDNKWDALDCQGATGATGATGDSGATGTAGANGSKGTAGATGPVGAVGPKGTTGPAGETGAAGEEGEPGSSILWVILSLILLIVLITLVVFIILYIRKTSMKKREEWS